MGSFDMYKKTNPNINIAISKIILRLVYRISLNNLNNPVIILA